MEIYTCNGTDGQQWTEEPAGAGYTVHADGKCLDDTGWSTTPGTQVQIWDCTGGANQSWSQP